MHNLCLIILATKTIFFDLLCITFKKFHVKLQRHPSNNFIEKIEKVQKNA